MTTTWVTDRGSHPGHVLNGREMDKREKKTVKVVLK